MALESIITEHIDIWTSAIKARSSAGRGSSKKLDLYGVKKLRELILELAVRGKLVPQDSNDEPASELLKRIEAEKIILAREGKIKKQKQILSISEENKPFKLAKGWEWATLAQTGIGATGKTPPTKKTEYFEGDIPFLGPGQITNSGLIIDADKFLSEDGINLSTEALVGDILMVCIGGSIGKSAICNNRMGFNQQINALRPLLISPKYLNHAVSTGYFYRSVLNKSTGSATPIINRSKWEELLVPLCSLAEQHRIVNKVDELMALCDQLESQTEASIDAHKTLVEVLLATLTNAKDADELNDSWQRISQHFDVLFTTQDSIDQLKQTILQLAVMGKLVKQNPNDEPAAKLLERIAVEKEQLVKDKKIKKQIPLSIITDEEKMFVIPDGWDWCKFGDISHLITDGAHHTPKYIGSGVPFLSVKDMSSGILNFSDTRFISKEQHEELTKRCKPQKGDLLLTKIGTTGVPVIIDTDIEFSIFVSVALIKFPVDKINGQFLSLLIKSPLVKIQSKEGTEGVGNKNLVLRKIAIFNLVLPPLGEQERIVKKVNELISSCDLLKANLKDAQTTQLHLTDAIVEKAL
jgi:type I restriction enzyme S subunit